MDTKNHTVTIPIEDYNALIKAKELIGLERLSEKSDVYQAILKGATSLTSHDYQSRQVNPLADIDIFTRRIVR